MSVGEYCNREVIVADPSTPIIDIASLMREHHVGSVVIVNVSGGNNFPVGIITDRDIVLQIVATSVETGSITAGDVMSADLLTAREIEGIWETLQRMRARGIRRVPIVNDEQVLVGILTVDDVLESIVTELNELSHLISREQRREAALRSRP